MLLIESLDTGLLVKSVYEEELKQTVNLLCRPKMPLTSFIIIKSSLLRNIYGSYKNVTPASLSLETSTFMV